MSTDQKSPLMSRDYSSPLSDTYQRHLENEEAVKLQMYLANNYPEFQPRYPEGLFAWALAALKSVDGVLE